MNNAIVLVGDDPDRTPRMIDELMADAAPSQELVLLSRDELTHSDERIRYVRARSLTATADLERAGIVGAGRIIIFASNDNETLAAALRSEAHTSELQSLMRNSYAVFCLKKQKIT